MDKSKPFAKALARFSVNVDRNASPDGVYMEGRWISWPEVDTIVSSVLYADAHAAEVERNATEYWQNEHERYHWKTHDYCPVCIANLRKKETVNEQ